MLIFHLHVVFALTTILRTRSDVADRGRGVYCFISMEHPKTVSQAVISSGAPSSRIVQVPSSVPLSKCVSDRKSITARPFRNVKTMRTRTYHSVI